ncbi:MAG TPA: CBS domain-containing protein [Kofleriaceae bacterium]|nr:CBS domain-containing protein [Kofleriaceae bacterium]
MKDLEVDELAALWSDAGEDDDEIERLVEDDSRSRFASGTGTFHLGGERRAVTDTDLEPEPPRVEARGAAPVASLMARKVVCARPEMDASDARRRMLERGVSGLPVVDAWGRAIGVISKTDLVAHEVTADGGRVRVRDIMTPLVFALSPDASIARAAALMAYEGVHRIIIVDASGHLLGVVTSLDIARWVGESAGLPVGRTP